MSRPSTRMRADNFGWAPYRPSHKPWSGERRTLEENVHAPIRRSTKATTNHLDGELWEQFPAPPCSTT